FDGETTMKRPLAAALAATLLAGCATAPAARDTPPDGSKAADTAKSSFIDDPYASTYVAPASQPVLIQGATVLTGTGTRLDGADVLMRDGRIEAVGVGL